MFFLVLTRNQILTFLSAQPIAFYITELRPVITEVDTLTVKIRKIT